MILEETSGGVDAIKVGMTSPRQVLPGITYFLTRRCANRRFLLLPSKESRHAFEYCLARASRVHQVQVHSYCAMSNHYHLVVTDVEGNLPDFMCLFNRILAMCIKHIHQWEENVWSSQRYSAVELPSFEGVMEKMVYTVTNPVSAGLVRYVKKWPGAWGYVSRKREERTLSCPKVFFRKENPKNQEETLVFHRPKDAMMQQGYEEKEWDEAFEKRLLEREEEIGRERRKQGKGCMHRASIMKQSPYRRERGKQRRGEPKVVSGGEENVWKRFKERLKEFRRSYREAYERWKEGGKVVFPAGTWWVVKMAGARREEGLPDWRMCYG